MASEQINTISSNNTDIPESLEKNTITTNPYRKNLLTFVIPFFIGGVFFGILGFQYGKQNYINEKITPTSNSNPTPSILLKPTDPPIPHEFSEENFTCSEIKELMEYKFCKDENNSLTAYITGPSSLRIEHVKDYTVSPTNKWMFIKQFSKNSAENGGAPDENALTMLDLSNNKIYELFSQIYVPNYTEKSWSQSGAGIVFTAGEAATPNILGNPNLFAVVYCSTTCKTLAKNAGPAGIMGDPAFFSGNKVHYTGINNEPIEIPLE